MDTGSGDGGGSTRKWVQERRDGLDRLLMEWEEWTVGEWDGGEQTTGLVIQHYAPASNECYGATDVGGSGCKAVKAGRM